VKAVRVLLATFPVASHLFPMVPLGLAFAAAGHEVLVASLPGFVPVIESTGLTGLGVGKEPDFGRVWADDTIAPLDGAPGDEAARLRAARAVQMFCQVGADMAADLVPWARANPVDLVVYEPRAYAGVLAAAATGVPAVRHLWGVDQTYGRWSFERSVVAAMFDQQGHPEVDPHGVLTLDPCPPSMQTRTPSARLGVRFVPYNGDGVVPDGLRAPGDRPRICVTWGSTVARQLGHLDPAREVVRAGSQLDAEVLVCTSEEQVPLFGPLPPDVRLLSGSPPLREILPGCAVVAHPGGAGTLLTAAALGVPQLVVPAVGDQFLNAEQYAMTGAGLACSSSDPLRPALTRLLSDPARRTAARALAEEIAVQPAPSQLVERLLNFPF
jgi:UDP:flavonoid glycosyltransferase YjiC (YdhE family)